MRAGGLALWASPGKRKQRLTELRGALSAKGIERAQAFSWMRTAQMVAAVLSEVAHGQQA